VNGQLMMDKEYTEYKYKKTYISRIPLYFHHHCKGLSVSGKHFEPSQYCLCNCFVKIVLLRKAEKTEQICYLQTTTEWGGTRGQIVGLIELNLQHFQQFQLGAILRGCVIICH
jgi:hypothetical protein